jgi:dTDP-4-amino-4,6-dideoxygalactose transaminase
VERPGWTHAWHLYILRLRDGVLSIGRDQVIDELRERGIGTSVHFIPLHMHSFYKRTLRHRPGSFPHAEREYARAISLPLFPGLALEDLDRVVECLLDIAARYRR